MRQESGGSAELRQDRVYADQKKSKLKQPLIVEAGKEIKLAKNLKGLSIVLDKSLNWHAHLKHLKTKIEQIIATDRKMTWMNQAI